MAKTPNQKADTPNSNNVNLSHNNSAYKAAQNNRSGQLNPNSPRPKGRKP